MHFQAGSVEFYAEDRGPARGPRRAFQVSIEAQDFAVWAWRLHLIVSWGQRPSPKASVEEGESAAVEFNKAA